MSLRAPIFPFRPRRQFLQLGVLLLLACWSASGCGHRSGEPASGTSEPILIMLSTNVIHIGDPIDVTISFDHSAGSRIHAPDLNRQKDIIVRAQGQRSENVAKNRRRTTLSYQLTSLVVGQHILSTGTVECTQSDGSVTSLLLPPTRFTVLSYLSDTNASLRDIKDLARWPAVLPRWLMVLLLIGLLAAVLGSLVARFLRKPRTILHHPPPPPPHEVAMAALADLLRRGWIEQGDVGPFYVALSTIVRRYIEDRFGLRAPERTTEEFIRETVGSRLLSAGHQALTREFLEQCDLVKFARHRPTADNMRHAHAAAHKLVAETAPQPAPRSADVAGAMGGNPS